MIFWTKFAQKGCFQSKTEKVNTSTEFCLFELALVLTDNFDGIFFDKICPKRVPLVENGKIALVHVSMVVIYYFKLFCTGESDTTVF